MKRIMFVSDKLVKQIIEGRKTTSEVPLDEVDIDEDDYNHALVVGHYYEVFDSLHVEYFVYPDDDFEFIAYYFNLANYPVQ